MSQPTPHSHLGLKVHFDELEPAGVIIMRSSTWEQLKAESGKHVSFLREHDIATADSTSLNATSIGPISGPDAGAGPLVPAGSLETPALAVPNPDDTNPNPQSVQETVDGSVSPIAAEPTAEPYPTDPAPPAPTETIAAVENQPSAEEHHD